MNPEYKATHKDENSGSGHSSPTIQRRNTVAQSNSDDRKAKIAGNVRYGLVFIFCAIYFIGQLILYLDTDSNQITNASIDPISSIEVPFFYVYTAPNVSEPFLFILTSANDYSFSEQYYIWPDRMVEWDANYVYDSTQTNWTAMTYDLDPGSTETHMLIIPPYNSKLHTGESVSIVFVTSDQTSDALTKSEYIDKMQANEQSQGSFQLQWICEYIEFRDGNFAEYFGSAFPNFQTATFGTSSTYEIDVLEMDNFGDITTKYSEQFVSNYGGRMQIESDALGDGTTYWQHYTMLHFSINSMETKLTIAVDQKMSFLDVCSKTGGIFGLIFPFSAVILMYALKGVKVGQIGIPGIAPNAGLDEEQKRKTLIFLKEIEFAQTVNMNANEGTAVGV